MPISSLITRGFGSGGSALKLIRRHWGSFGGTIEGAMVADGDATAAAEGFSPFNAAAVADGDATAAAVGLDITPHRDVEADGTSTAAGVGESENEAVFSADGDATATPNLTGIHPASFSEAGDATAWSHIWAMQARTATAGGSATAAAEITYTVSGGGSSTALGYPVRKPRSVTGLGNAATVTAQSRGASAPALTNRGSQTTLRRTRALTKVGDF